MAVDQSGGFQLFSQGVERRDLPSDPVTRADIQHVLEHGYVILPDCFTKAEAKDARDEIDRLLGDTPRGGRNAFEGFNTNRIYSLLNKTRVFDKFTILPRVLALNDYFLDPGYQLSAFHTITINRKYELHVPTSTVITERILTVSQRTAGEAKQNLHHDDGYIAVKRPRPPFGAAIMLAFDEYTAANGATRIIPGSHLWDSERKSQNWWISRRMLIRSSGRGSEADTIPALVPEGGACYFISTLIHGGGTNTTSAPRQSATVQYCQPYIRPIECQLLAVDPRKLKDIDSRIVDMMGYKEMKPFMGYVDALNPRFGAQRMVEWLKKDVDHNPPTFAREHKL